MAQTNPAAVTEGVPAGAPVLELRHVSKRFGENVVLRDFNMSVYEGENVAVMGRSGCGKSVLIKCIVGLMTADGGELNVFGKSVTRAKRRELDDIRRHIGFVFQSSALYDSMTVRENLQFQMRHYLNNRTRREAEERVKEALDNVGLAHTIDMMPSELSGGMKKRIGIARSLVLKPRIILYDEPTTGLDPITAKEIDSLIAEVQAKYKATAVIITHDMACIKRTCNRALLLADGICYAEGTYQELSRNPDERVKAFFE